MMAAIEKLMTITSDETTMVSMRIMVFMEVIILALRRGDWLHRWPCVMSSEQPDAHTGLLGLRRWLPIWQPCWLANA